MSAVDSETPDDAGDRIEQHACAIFALPSWRFSCEHGTKRRSPSCPAKSRTGVQNSQKLPIQLMKLSRRPSSQSHAISPNTWPSNSCWSEFEPRIFAD